MDRRYFVSLAEEIIDGKIHDDNIYKDILSMPDNDMPGIIHGAEIIRDFYFGREIHLCTICNGKSGRCSEDCKFCSQSIFYRTGAPTYPLMDKNGLQRGGLYAYETPINNYSIVTTGKRLPSREVKAVAEAMSGLDGEKIKRCVSLGILEQEDLKLLKMAGIERYHHNLETCEDYFSEVCSTHTYQERANTILSAQGVGLKICSGGIFGIGETDEHILELAISLRSLNVDSIPINFLVPIKGTPFGEMRNLTPSRCLRIIAFFRYFLPGKEIIICGGRMQNLCELHEMIFSAGASGIMTGNYLTTEGRSLRDDLRMIEELGFFTRRK
jgi:biotin synthase